MNPAIRLFSPSETSNDVFTKYIKMPYSQVLSLVLGRPNANEINGFEAPPLRGQVRAKWDKTVEGRFCPNCGQFKMLSDYYKNRSKPDGHESHCKVCVLAKKAKPKRLKGGEIELTLKLKPSESFNEGLSGILDIICKELVESA